MPPMPRQMPLLPSAGSRRSGVRSCALAAGLALVLLVAAGATAPPDDGGALVTGRPERPWQSRRPRTQRVAASHELHHAVYHLTGPPFFSPQGLPPSRDGAFAEVYPLDDRVAAVGLNGTWSWAALGTRHRLEERAPEAELQFGIDLCVLAMR